MVAVMVMVGAFMSVLVLLLLLVLLWRRRWPMWELETTGRGRRRRYLAVVSWRITAVIAAAGLAVEVSEGW